MSRQSTERVGESMTVRMRGVSLLVAIATFVGVPSARAQTAEAAATALFDEGRKLLAQHRYAEACPKFAESQRLAPSGGTLLNLADCYEHVGQTASAWATWKDAAARANAAGKRDVERRALGRADALEPNLARLAIAVAPESNVAGLEIQRDGVHVGAAEYGLAMPVDPGKHTVEARAPNKKDWSMIVDVAAKQTDARVTVFLEDDRASSAPTPPAQSGQKPPGPAAVPSSGPSIPEEPPQPTGNGQRIAALVALGTGVVGLGVGSAFGLVAMAKNNEALKPENCRTSTACTPMGLSFTQDARDAATVSTIAFAVGGAAIATAVVVWLTSPRGTPPVRVTAGVAGSYAGVSLLSVW